MQNASETNRSNQMLISTVDTSSNKHISYRKIIEKGTTIEKLVPYLFSIASAIKYHQSNRSVFINAIPENLFLNVTSAVTGISNQAIIKNPELNIKLDSLNKILTPVKIRESENDLTIAQAVTIFYLGKTIQELIQNAREPINDREEYYKQFLERIANKCINSDITIDHILKTIREQLIEKTLMENIETINDLIQNLEDTLQARPLPSSEAQLLTQDTNTVVSQTHAALVFDVDLAEVVLREDISFTDEVNDDTETKALKRLYQFVQEMKQLPIACRQYYNCEKSFLDLQKLIEEINSKARNVYLEFAEILKHNQKFILLDNMVYSLYNVTLGVHNGYSFIRDDSSFTYPTLQVSNGSFGFYACSNKEEISQIPQTVASNVQSFA